MPLLARPPGRVASPSSALRARSVATVLCRIRLLFVAPALLCLDADIIATSPRGERRIAVAEFFRGFYETALEPGDILTAVAPAPSKLATSAYLKFCPRSMRIAR